MATEGRLADEAPAGDEKFVVYEGIELEKVVIIGRTFEEYSRMFLLDEIPADGRKILDAAGGVSSFTKEASDRGWQVMSLDPVYCHGLDALKEKCSKDLDHLLDLVVSKKHLFRWEKPHETVDEIRDLRTRAYTTFLGDFQVNRYRYFDAMLPHTPYIADNNFKTTLMSHLLFAYGQFLGYETHLAIFKELVRVTSEELRFFPLLDCNTLEQLPHLERLKREPALSGLEFKIHDVPYEFLKGTGRMLVVKKPG